jgi:phosphoglycerol geranylgeranyltransferase
MLTSSISCKVSDLLEARSKCLAVLIDPDKFDEDNVASFLNNLPANATLIFVGGSTVEHHVTSLVVQRIKAYTSLPVILFPGDYSQITEEADALLFLSLISGRNPEYLIEQQIKSVAQLRNSSLEIIPTGYILIDGGTESAVQRVSKTTPISQEDVELIVNTALAGQYSGKKLIYLEAGSGAKTPISDEIIREVKNAITIPLIVGGGIRSSIQFEKAYSAGADIVVVGTAFEQNNFKS